MEDLLVLLDKIQTISPLPVFSQELIIVQNQGLQHWLNLSLAEQRGISLNVRYALPAQFLWKLIRDMASDDDVPEQSPYSREVLTWRIYALLASETVINDDVFAQTTAYWQGKKEKDKSQMLAVDDIENASLKRYQLACQLADLYEQYLIFRPEWIDAWHKKETENNSVKPNIYQSANTVDNSHNKSNDIVDDAIDAEVNATVQWQAKLWQLLTQEQAYNPKTLLQEAIKNIVSKKALLPKRISFFGLNAMAPMWLEFIHALSEHIDVHFFHLNPCFAYWGDIQTEKQAIKAIAKWTDGFDELSHYVGNPLLANFGQQGREFMALLHSYSTINIDVFDKSEQTDCDKRNTGKLSVLAKVQQDILSLTDARVDKIDQQDDSITITSCHSALREVQGLHDWLLHQFNQDSSLTPKDIIVMCPQVENYAPYVNAVFTRGWQDIDDEIPPLPCSIADRVSKDSEPVVAAFVELLNLPDSRFQVSQLVSFLRLPALQLKFNLTLEEIDKIIVWLDLSAIHWGLNRDHKQGVLAANLAESSSVQHVELNNNFTWQQGLSRLLQGFAYGDQEVIHHEQLILPNVEGNDAILLEKLMLIIDQLQVISQQLSHPRTATQWHNFLFNLLDELFDTDSESGFGIINHAIESLVEYCGHANFNEKVTLAVIRDFLDSHFSQPDPGRQFMVGQVTFCSMLPMRSIPFKIIAVLGLNDGEFPRQRQPLGFDLMSVTPAKLGDRSRRGDDRYLFLEAIISARSALYLSYQGRNISTNKTKEASLVLKELMEYLALGYGWCFDEDLINESPSESGEENIKKERVNQNEPKQRTAKRKNQLRQLPMQPYSRKNYFGRYPSFDAKWLALGRQNEAKYTDKAMGVGYSSETTLIIAPVEQTFDKNESNVVNLTINASQLVRFFQHPARAFAQQQLNLYFDQNNIELEDSEPFSHDYLQSYLLRQELLDVYLQDVPGQNLEQAVESKLEKALLSGNFPDLPTTKHVLQGWQEDSKNFSQQIIEQDLNQAKIIEHLLTIEIQGLDGIQYNIDLQVDFAIKNNQIVFYRSSGAKAKDYFTLYLHQLMLQVSQENLNKASEMNKDLAEVTATTGMYFETKSQKITQFQFSALIDAKSHLIHLLQTYLLGQQQALLLNGDIGQLIFNKKTRSAKKAKPERQFQQDDFENLWYDNKGFGVLGEDDYLQYFWPKCPQYNEHQLGLEQIYQPMYQSLVKVG